jgi:hypothetical protein
VDKSATAFIWGKLEFCPNVNLFQIKLLSIGQNHKVYKFSGHQSDISDLPSCVLRFFRNYLTVLNKISFVLFRIYKALLIAIKKNWGIHYLKVGLTALNWIWISLFVENIHDFQITLVLLYLVNQLVEFLF